MEDLGRVSPEEFKKIQKLPVVLLLDNVRSLHNVGSAFRTADAFSASKIILCGITGTPPNREMNKTALGATESVDWEYYPETMDAIVKLKGEGYRIISLEQTEGSLALQNFIPDLSAKYCFVFGNEVEGVKQDVIDTSDNCVEIPQFGTKHSMNISVTIGIVFWHYFLSRK